VPYIRGRGGARGAGGGGFSVPASIWLIRGEEGKREEGGHRAGRLGFGSVITHTRLLCRVMRCDVTISFGDCWIKLFAWET
jgi:hypothetical protein